MASSFNNSMKVAKAATGQLVIKKRNVFRKTELIIYNDFSELMYNEFGFQDLKNEINENDGEITIAVSIEINPPINSNE